MANPMLEGLGYVTLFGLGSLVGWLGIKLLFRVRGR